MKVYESLQSNIGQFQAGVLNAPVYMSGVEEGTRSKSPGFFNHIADNTSEFVTDHPYPTIVGGAVMGLAIGASVELIARRNINRNNLPIVESYGDAFAGIEPNRWHRTVSALVSLPAVAGIGFGALSAAAWTSAQDQAITPPHIEVMVDKSGATLDNEQQAAIAVRSSVAQIGESLTDFSSNVSVATSNRIVRMSLEDAVSYVPFGDAPMSQAYVDILDEARISRDKLKIGDEVTNTAVIAITNGNNISGLVENPDELAVSPPVYVLNVSKSGGDEAELRRIAEITNGEYIDIASLDTIDERAKVLDQIASRVESVTTDSNNKPNWLLRVGIPLVGLMSLLRWAPARYDHNNLRVKPNREERKELKLKREEQ